MTNHRCIQQKVLDKLIKDNETRGIDSAKMTVKIDNIEKNVSDIKKDMKEFINSADNKYATKKELAEGIKVLEKENIRQDDEIGWNKEKLIDVAFKVAMILAVLGIGGKSFGIF